MAYTDFADEIFVRGTQQQKPPSGVRLASATQGNVRVTRVEIVRSGLARPKGRYISIETPALSILDERDSAVIDTAADQLRSLLPEQGSILVVGVGNRRVTADALGPRVAQKILVTAGTKHALPQSLPNVRTVYAIAPGVAGATGIALVTLLQAMVASVKPACVLCVDSLVSGEVARLGRTMQFSDTGLCPAHATSTKHITQQQLGVPVIAAGIPMLMDSDLGENFITVPRALDTVVSHGASLLSAAINRALQPNFTLAQLCWLSS